LVFQQAVMTPVLLTPLYCAAATPPVVATPTAVSPMAAASSRRFVASSMDRPPGRSVWCAHHPSGQDTAQQIAEIGGRPTAESDLDG
jgi:hypothetical protein